MLDFTSGSVWESLQKNVQENIPSKKEKKDFNDPRMWKLERDENDTGSALIRLVPDKENIPYVLVYSHSFSTFDPVKKKARWFIRNSPETINLPSPASQLWAALRNYSEDKVNGELESKNFNRKMTYYSNIKVLSDPANKTNNNQIKIWGYGTKMFEKFISAQQLTEQERELGVKPKDLFNPLKGNSILLKIKMGSNKIPTYDDSTFEESSSIYNSNEEAVKDIMENSHKLTELLEPESFDTYEELKKSLLWVLECYDPKFLDKATFKKIVAETFGESLPQTSTPAPKATPKEEPKVEAKTPTKESKPTPAPVDDDLGFLDELDNL